MQKIGMSIPEIEKQRIQMELNLTQDILIFNQRVTKQIKGLESNVTDEINGLTIELEKEENRRVNNDKMLLT